MSCRSMGWACVGCCIAIWSLGVHPHPAVAGPRDVETALRGLDRRLEVETTGPNWRRYLRADELRGLLTQGDKADPAAVAEILGRFSSGAPGLEVSEFRTARGAIQQWLSELQLSQVGGLADLAQTAKQHFQPVAAAQAQQAGSRLVAALELLEERIRAAGPGAAEWRNFLQLDRLQEQLRSPQPEMHALGQVYQRFASGHEGLGLVWFADVRDALRHYLELSGAIGNPDVRSVYEQTLDRLSKLLQQYAAGPNADAAAEIEDAIRWLESAEQAPALVNAIRQRYLYPNLYLQIAEGTATAGINDLVSEITPIQDVILGTTICGTGYTNGQIRGSLAPNADFGVVDATFHGLTQSRNVGYHGPAQVYSSGLTSIGTRTRLWIDATGVYALPSVSSAVTDSTITDLDLSRGGRLVEKIAWKKAHQQQSAAESVASRHAEQKANARADQRAAEALARANAGFQEKFREPLLQRRLFPQLLQFSTTPAAIHVTALRADAAQLGAPTAPVPLVESADMGMQLHETLANNMAFSALAGMTVRDETFQKAVVDFLGRLPERLKPDDEKEPWAITFAARQPISASFADNTLRVTIRGRRYFKGEESYPGMNVTAEYKIVGTDQGFRLVREKELEIFPPGFTPGSGEKLSSRQVVIRTLLQRRFGKMFDKEVRAEGFALPGAWAKGGRMVPMQMTAHAGWLTIAWRRVPDPKTAMVEGR